MQKLSISLVLIVSSVFILNVSCKKNKIKPSEQPEQPAAIVDTARTDTLGKVVISLSGMKNSSGNINVAIYNSSSSFNDPQNVYRTVTVSAVSGSMVITIDDLPPGYYAFGLFHDENANNSIDKNILSIPKEGFAFSNNATANFGPPSYDQAKFYLPKKSTLTQIISLIFY